MFERTYRRLPRALKIAIAVTFAWVIAMPVMVVDGAVSGWKDFIVLYRERMGHMKGDKE